MKTVQTKQIKITVKKTKKDAAYCGGGCNGCSCGHKRSGVEPISTVVFGKKSE